MGFGHVYAPEHYLDAWVAVTGSHKWKPETLAALKKHLAAQARRSAPPGDDNPYEDRGG
jgi:uncharacterized membrane protein